MVEPTLPAPTRRQRFFLANSSLPVRYQGKFFLKKVELRKFPSLKGSSLLFAARNFSDEKTGHCRC
jgi:hypothetical protein